MSTMEQRERYESLYHATTQYLLVRDFKSAEDSVLSLLDSRPRDELEQKLIKYTDRFEPRLKRWARSSEDMIKAYKLYAFVLTSRHAERLESVQTGSSGASRDLKQVFDNVISTYETESAVSGGGPDNGNSDPRLVDLHPSILQTILLSLLKLNTSYPVPYSESLPSTARSEHPLFIARTFIERWLAGLEEETIKTLSFPKRFIARCKASTSSGSNGSVRGSGVPSREVLTEVLSNNTNTDGHDSADDDWAWYAISERLGGMNKSYRAVLRTYVLEILPRFGDWDLSRDMILAGLFPRAEEQEKLLKKLHTLELQHKQLQRANQTLISASTSDLSRSTSSLSSSFSELDASESIAGPSTIRPSPVRPPSPSAASVQTDRTVRAVDYMKGRKALEVPGRQESRNGMGSAERGTDEKADERGANEESGSKRADDDSVVGSTRSLTQGSARFGHAAFETLRARIVRYLDTPIDGDPERGLDETSDDRRPRTRRSLSISRRSNGAAKLPLHQRLSRNFTFRLVVRALSLVSIVAFVLSLIRRRRRRRAMAQGGSVAGEMDLVQDVREAFAVVKEKVMAVFKMGTTISYV